MDESPIDTLNLPSYGISLVVLFAVAKYTGNFPIALVSCVASYFLVSWMFS